ncbi:TonB-dependent receptor plug domain-containing protein [Sulfurimonas marina]|uniref:TonB-dependent receptor n=1 Tax=Sulfurimonas marina TaxID=2590551 RepID=A0A7M3V960_9BACT|nr:TonB-dependent receptor [Sulfurimonas marina]QOP40293.1 TonB-dependent receptor [Sulfurimonas marina]
MQKKLQLSLLCIALTSQLNAQDINLESITVTSVANTDQKLHDVTANTEVITAEEIEERRFTTVTQALNSLSGINFSSNGGLGKATSVYLRGFDSKRVLVLIDGIRYNDLTGLDGAPFGHLMISDIERIEVIKGAQSGIWGADASAGVINIITKSAEKGFHAGADVEYGNYNTQKHALNLSYKTDTYYVKAASQLLTSDGFSTKVPKGENVDDYEADGYKNITSDLKLGFQINETNKVDFSYTRIDAYSEYDPYDSNDTIEANKYGEDETHDSFGQINFNHIDSFNEFKLYAKRSIFNRQYLTDNPTSHYNGSVYEYGANSKIGYDEKDFVLIAFDYKTFEHENALNEKYKNQAGTITNSNIFKIDSGEIILTEALRYDHYDMFDDKTTGKAGVKYNSKKYKTLSFSTNIGSAYNVPTLYNLYSYYGNENLKPEDTTSFDATIEYKGFKATYFYNRVKNMIDYDFTISKYNNIQGTSILKGFELGYKEYLTDEILADISYTYLDAKNEDKEALRRRPQDTIKFAFAYYPTQKLQLGVDGEYIGSRFDRDNNQGVQTGYYTLVNFVANYKIDKNFTTYFKVDNIADTDYQVVDGYATAQRSTYLGVSYRY